MYQVLIKNNKTNEVRKHEEKGDFDDNTEYWWSEGNMSCDCNRHLMFEADDEDTDVKCGDDLYSIQIRAKNGLTLYNELMERIAYYENKDV